MAPRSCICSSSSVGIWVTIGQLLRVPHLVQQDVERGEIGVPLDQGWDWAEPLKRNGVKIPNRGRNPGTVVCYHDVDMLGGLMAGKMDLADRWHRQGVQIGDRVEPEVARADIDVVNVAEDPAAGSAGGLGQELRLRDG